MSGRYWYDAQADELRTSWSFHTDYNDSQAKEELKRKAMSAKISKSKTKPETSLAKYD